MKYKSLFPITREYQGRVQLTLDLGFKEDFLYEVTDTLKLEEDSEESSAAAINPWKALRVCTDQK